MQFLLYSILDVIPILLTSLDAASQVTTLDLIIFILIGHQTTLDTAIQMARLEAVPEVTLDVDHDVYIYAQLCNNRRSNVIKPVIIAQTL